MDYRTFWNQIVIALQSSQSRWLHVDASNADLGMLDVSTQHGDYKSAKVAIVIRDNTATAEIQLNFAFRSPESDARLKRSDRERGIARYTYKIQRYRFKTGNGNEGYQVIPHLTEENSAFHVASIGEERTPQLAHRIARWVEDVVLSNTYQRSRTLGARNPDEIEAIRLSGLMKEADTGNHAAFGQALEIIADDDKTQFYIEWLKTHAERGRASAQRLLGIHLLRLPSSVASEEQEKDGLRWLRLAAEQSCPLAAYDLAEHYVEFKGGIGGPEDPGFEDWRVGWCGHYVDASGLRSCFGPVREGDDGYRFGPEDVCLREAWRWLSRSAELGHPMARYKIAMGRIKKSGGSLSSNDLTLHINELRELATQGHQLSILALSGSKHVTENERSNWAAHGAGLGYSTSQRVLAGHFNTGQAGHYNHGLAIKWLQRSYARAKDSADLDTIGCIHYEDDVLTNGSLFHAIDAWRRHQRKEGKYSDGRWFKVRIHKGHMLIQEWGVTYILDTGSATSPTLDELDVRFPGIKAYIQRNIDKDVVGIFGNDRIMSGSGFVLDMRHGDSGTLWIAESYGVASKAPDRLPLVTFEKLERANIYDRLTTGDGNVALTAYIDTGAQYSYLRLPLTRTNKRAEDFTLLDGRFETFNTSLQTIRVRDRLIVRECEFGNLPEHLSERVFSNLNVDAILGPEFLHGALLCWRRKDNLCFVQEGIHADMAESLIGAELNAAPTEVPSGFKSYFLGLGEYGHESFQDDISAVLTEDSCRTLPDGTKTWTLNIVEFNDTGRASHLIGRHRTHFIVACYFKVLINQVFHHHFNAHHAKYESLGDTVKLTLIAPNINPDYLLNGTVRVDPAADAAFVQARAFFESDLKEKVRTHFPQLDAGHVWKTVEGYLPGNYPYLTQPTV